MKKEELLKQLHTLRMVAIAEGISFLVSLLIAIPLQYLFDMPELITILSWMIHGTLVISFSFFVIIVFTPLDKDAMWLVKALLSSLIPFGPFILQRELKMEEQILYRRR
jgi:integral membrane protein